MSELIKVDKEYKEWISRISTDFRNSQIRASVKINDEMLRFYGRLGKGISDMSEQFGYGTVFFKIQIQYRSQTLSLVIIMLQFLQ